MSNTMPTKHCRGSACCGEDECACDVDIAAILAGHEDPCFGCTYAEASVREREDLAAEWDRREAEADEAADADMQEEDDAIDRAFGEDA